MKFVFPWFGPVRCLVEEFVKINFEGEFKTIIDLRGRVRIVLAAL